VVSKGASKERELTPAQRAAVSKFFLKHGVNAEIDKAGRTLIYDRSKDALVLDILEHYGVRFDRRFLKNRLLMFRSLNGDLLVCAAMFLYHPLEKCVRIELPKDIDVATIYEEFQAHTSCSIGASPSNPYRMFVTFAFQYCAKYFAEDEASSLATSSMAPTGKPVSGEEVSAEESVMVEETDTMATV